MADCSTSWSSVKGCGLISQGKYRLSIFSGKRRIGLCGYQNALFSHMTAFPSKMFNAFQRSTLLRQRVGNTMPVTLGR